MYTPADIVKREYRDLGLNRWVWRNRSLHRTLIYSVWTLAIAFALVDIPKLTLIFGGSWVAWMWILALEHMWIGREKERIGKIIEANGYEFNWEQAWEQSGLK